MRKEPGHEKSPVDLPVVGFGVGRLECGLCRGWVLCNTKHESGSQDRPDDPYDTKDDGALQKGVAWPIPRFTDNINGTVTDNLTRLIWMKNANAFGTKTWADALTTANGLKSGVASRTAPRRVTGACPTSGNSRAWSIMHLL